VILVFGSEISEKSVPVVGCGKITTDKKPQKEPTWEMIA
jgi:hypothetical protein